MTINIKSDEILEMVLSIVDEGIIITDNIGRIMIMNKKAEEYTGWNASALIENQFTEFSKFIDMDTHQNIANIIMDFSKNGEKYKTHENKTLISENGSAQIVSCTLSRASSIHDKNFSIIISIKDITKEHMQEIDYIGFMNANLDILCVFDHKENFLRVNNKFVDIFGYTEEEIKGSNYYSFIYDEDILSTQEAVKVAVEKKDIFVFTNRFRCKDNSFKYIRWHAYSSDGKFIYCSANDVTEEKTKEEELMSLAVKDALTGLYNRYYFNNMLDSEIESAESFNHALSIAILDIDHFKYINDTWGHPIGDELLRHIAEIVKRNIRSTDLFIRLGGEEFIIFMPQTKINGAIVALEKIRSAIENTHHQIAGGQTVSIGVAERFKSESLQEWYERADTALYKAKHQGRNQIVVANEL